MGIKYIHVVLIVASIILSLIFGVWTLKHNNAVSAYASFIIAAGLMIYCVRFLRKMKAL